MDVRHAQDRYKGAPVDDRRRWKWWNKADERNNPGTSRFEAGGVSFGAEICADHGDHRLLDEVLTEGAEGVDVSMLLSASSNLAEQNLGPRDGGIAAHTDAAGRLAQVMTATGDRDVYDSGAEGLKVSQPWEPKPEDHEGYERHNMVRQGGLHTLANGASEHLGTFALPGR